MRTPASSNRIRELRKRAGLSSDALAKVIGVSGVQMRRIETGARSLKVEELRKIATELRCRPADLISNAVLAETDNEVQPVKDAMAEALYGSLAHLGLSVYQVTPAGESVIRAGVRPGDFIIVNSTPERLAALKSLDLVVVRLRCKEGFEAIVLRQYIGPAPGILVLNRDGPILGIQRDDTELNPEIIGVIVPKDVSTS